MTPNKYCLMEAALLRGHSICSHGNIRKSNILSKPPPNLVTETNVKPDMDFEFVPLKSLIFFSHSNAWSALR